MFNILFGFPALRVIASAPGKITLFGEHAIVYGYPAIVSSIDRRVYVRAEARSDNEVKIYAKDLRIPGVIVTYRHGEVIVETDYGKTLSAIAYIEKALEITSRYLGTRKGVNLEVTSEMPVGAGLGTSAAVSVATIAAYAKVLGHELSKEEIARLGWQVEKEVQGIASPMDTSITSYGGFLKIVGKGGKYEISKVRVDESLPFVIGYVEREATTKDLVNKVKELRERYGAIIDEIMRVIGEVTLRAEKALINNDLVTLGELMNINHGLLDALGVSNRKLNELVYAARNAGALGSKLTGAGGGGCVIALTPGKQEEVEVAMKLYATLTLKTRLGVEGVKVLVERP